jgi:hypothetical protein
VAPIKTAAAASGGILTDETSGLLASRRSQKASPEICQYDVDWLAGDGPCDTLSAIQTCGAFSICIR